MGMKTKEEVIRALKICIGDVDDNCDHCPYSPEYGKNCNGIEATRDALALLEGEEPQVMTWGEIVHSIEIESPAIWLEDRDKIRVIPALTIISCVTNSENATFVIRGKRIDVKRSDYGKRWRAWTARPTEEQRKAVKWDVGT